MFLSIEKYKGSDKVIKTKVLVVDDSVFMQKLISRLIEEDASLQVAGVARNGLEAVKMVGELRPDVVTMDVEMPVMNGLDALASIMEEHPTPVLMLSSLTWEGASETMTALEYGAVDFIAKPSGSISTDLFKIKEELLSKIKAVAQTRRSVLRSLRGKQSPDTAVREALPEPKRDAGSGCRTKPSDHIVAVGTSTGGPRALEAVIPGLPAGFPYPVMVVQHMPPKFTQSLAQRLDRLSRVAVVEAEDNQRLSGGTVYIAPGDYHMTVVAHYGEFRVALHRQSPRNGHRPSVDVLFESVSELSGLKRHYILMTGMGSDGAKGMRAAKLAGACSTIAESEETCVIYGMPRAAIEQCGVDYVVPVNRIASKIVEVTGL